MSIERNAKSLQDRQHNSNTEYKITFKTGITNTEQKITITQPGQTTLIQNKKSQSHNHDRQH